MTTTYQTASEACRAYVKQNPTAPRSAWRAWAERVGMNVDTAMTQIAKARKAAGLTKRGNGKGYTF